MFLLFFQILVLSYEPFISLPFFSHYPDDEPSHEGHPKFDRNIIFRVQTMSDLHSSCVHPPWTLSRLWHPRQYRMGFLNTWQGEVCMVAPPLLDGHSIFSFLSLPSFSHYPGDKPIHRTQTKSNWKIVFRLQKMLAQFTPYHGTLWTLSGLCHYKQYAMVTSLFQSLDSHWILERVMIFRSWPIPHKLCIVNHRGWSSLLHLFKPFS